MRGRPPLVAWLMAILVSSAAAQPVPPELSARLAKARLDGRVAAWCGGRFRPNRPRAFAVAVTSTAGGSRYLVLEADGTLETLAAFAGAADLACYTRAQAEALNRSIGKSEAIHGRIAPLWNTSVVCAFVENTTAVCWQFDPVGQALVRIGGWQT